MRTHAGSMAPAQEGARRHPAPEAAPCLRDGARRLRPASVLELAPRARHAVQRCGCLPGDAHPAPSRPPRRRRETEAVTKPHCEPGPPDTRARLPLTPPSRISRRPALPWKPPPSIPRGSRVGLGAPPARGTRAPRRSPAGDPRGFSCSDTRRRPPSAQPGRDSPLPVDRRVAAAHQPPRLLPSRRPPQADARARKDSERDGALRFSRRGARRRAARRDKARASRCRARAPQRPLGEGPFAARLLLPLPGFFSPRAPDHRSPAPRGPQTQLSAWQWLTPALGRSGCAWVCRDNIGPQHYCNFQTALIRMPCKIHCEFL